MLNTLWLLLVNGLLTKLIENIKTTCLCFEGKKLQNKVLFGRFITVIVLDKVIADDIWNSRCCCQSSVSSQLHTQIVISNFQRSRELAPGSQLQSLAKIFSIRISSESATGNRQPTSNYDCQLKHTTLYRTDNWQPDSHCRMQCSSNSVSRFIQWPLAASFTL